MNTYNLIHNPKSLVLIKKGCKYPRRSFHDDTVDQKHYMWFYLFHLLTSEDCEIIFHSVNGSVERILTSRKC